MKRFCVLAAVIFIFAVPAGGRGALSGLDLPGDAEYTFYYKDGGALRVSYADAARPRFRDGVTGESARFTSRRENEASEILAALNASAVRTEQVGKIKITYARSPRLMRRVRLGGDCVNLMIADDGEFITVGAPLILGGF